MSEQIEYMQTATATIVGGKNFSVLVLNNWDVENEMGGYTVDEVKQLIEMLNDSLEMMNKYNEAHKNLPLFEKVLGDADVQQENKQSF